MSERAIILVVLFAACTALFVTSPMDGNFWWSDAPRHALNGAFVKDMLATMPIADPKGWAIDYYLKYPALTILFYPPLFYFVEAGVFALLGVSDIAAQFTVILFAFLLSLSSYGVARFTMSRWSALGVALLTVGAPETAFWGRQVMLDVPAYALLVSGVYFFIRYLRNSRTCDVYFAMLCVLAAIYIKFNTVFIVPVLLGVLLARRGRRALADRNVIAALLLGVIGIVPAVLLTLHFGKTNLQSVSGREGDIPLTSIDAWLFYGKLLPDYTGYAGLVLGLVGAILLMARFVRLRETYLPWLFGGWFVFGYVFVSGIGVREPRHGLMISFPLILCAAITLAYLLPKRVAEVATFSLGLATLIYSIIFYPVPQIDGYRAVAEYVVKNAPKNAVVLFSGYRDGNFIFDLRAQEGRHDIATLRADKLFLQISVERRRGVGQSDYNEASIVNILRQAGVSLILYQPGFWEDLREMQRFAAVVHSKDFEHIASFEIGGTIGHDDKTIEVYRPTYPVTQRQKALMIQMPIIGAQFHGKVGTD